MIKCKDCKYSDKQDKVRYCHRLPPVIIRDNPAGTGIKSIFPEVENNDFCGEGEVEA
jgi:hypothetical protein